MNILILGGTGTLGRALIKRLQTVDKTEFLVHDIKVLSRDEHKQALLKKEFPKVQCVLGDLRNFNRIRPHFTNIQAVFHVAALKHVDKGEENPEEFNDVNFTGTCNAAKAAIEAQCNYFVFSSTDKAIDPINVYGNTKAQAEQVLYNLNKTNRVKFSVYRWGNVIGSQGSVIPQFIRDLRDHRRVFVTHPDMTRFWLPIEDAADYMIRSFIKARGDGAMLIPGIKAASVVRVIKTLASIMGIGVYEHKIIGLRPGEKLHESLVSVHRPNHINSLACAQYTDSELDALLRPLVDLYDRR